MHVFIFWCFVLFVFWQVSELGRSGSCVQCGGKGAHKDDCPRGKP